MFTLLAALFAAPAHAVPIEIDANVGIGPQWLSANGALGDAGPGFLAFPLDLYGIVDAGDLVKIRKHTPKKYKAMVPKSEIRVSPSIFIPEQLIISPEIGGGPAMYGASWTPLTLTHDFVDRSKVNVYVAAGPTLTVAVLPDDGIGQDPTVFARPGLKGKFEAEFDLPGPLVFSLGYEGRAYLPQGLDDGGFETVMPSRDTLWALGGAFVQVHVRFPKTIRM